MSAIRAVGEEEEEGAGESGRNLEKLTKLCGEQEEESRENVDQATFTELATILKKHIPADGDIKAADEDALTAIAESFRRLRQACVNSVQNQDLIRENTDIAHASSKFLKWLVNKFTTNEVGEEKALVAARCCLQFLTNFMVENVESAKVVGTFTHDITSLMMVTRDEKIVQYGSMCIHILLKLLPDIVADFDIKVIPLLLENTKWEFVMYAIETLVDSELFMTTRYRILETEIRVRLLQFVVSHTEIHLKLRQQVIILLAEDFKQKSDLILKSQLGNDEMACWEIASLLQLLCCISVIEGSVLVKDSSLLMTTIFLLKSIHAAARVEKNFADGQQSTTHTCDFSPVPDLSALSFTSASSNKLASSPTFEFKANLIQLIANLIYRNRPFQELVRETEALSVILDNCKIDARNPFITQVAVFAIRNACENNSANQQIIREIQQMDTENALIKIQLTSV